MANALIYAVVTIVSLLLFSSILTSESESKGQLTTGQGSTAYSGRLNIEFITVSGHSNEVTIQEVTANSVISGSLDQQGRFDLISTVGTGECRIRDPSSDELHVHTGTPKFRLAGDTKGVAFTTDLSISTSCSIPNPAGEGFAFQISDGHFSASHGQASQNECELPNCSRDWYWELILVATGSTSNSGCLIDTDKSDDLVGTSQNDCINGNGGNDRVTGQAGNDKLNGGDGKDLLMGGNGNDELTGGKGADKFDCGAGQDKIMDFKPSEGDIKSSNCEQF